MNLVTITLIGCVIYFSEYKITKKALMIAVFLVIVLVGDDYAALGLHPFTYK